jgi:hypothetical protein
MTIQREHRSGPFVVQCDTCQDTEELEGYEFQEALADAKARGFVTRKEGETWVHYCRSCK